MSGRLFMVYEFSFDEEIVRRETWVFGSEEAAKIAFDTKDREVTPEDYPKESLKAIQMMKEATARKLEGKTIIKTLVWDRELLKAKHDSAEPMRRWLEEKKSEKK
jgi:hypothetical protein